MKKIILGLAIASTLFSTSSFAQDAATTKGDVLLDFGVGFVGGDFKGYDPGSYGTTTWSYSNADTKVAVPTLSMALQKAFWNDITIGGQVAYNAFVSVHDVNQSDGYYQHSKHTQSNVYATARGEYHFGRLLGWGRKYDLYAGALAGFVVSSNHDSQIYEGWGTGQPGTYRNDYPNKTTTQAGPAGGIFGGIRYYFTGGTSVYAEAGPNVTVIRVGLAWRF